MKCHATDFMSKVMSLLLDKDDRYLDVPGNISSKAFMSPLRVWLHHFHINLIIVSWLTFNECKLFTSAFTIINTFYETVYFQCGVITSLYHQI